MIPALQEKNKISFWQKVRIKVRYGMSGQVIRKQIQRTGIEISPYYLFLEGEGNSAVPAKLFLP
jgi:hypothetical protein